MEKYKNFKDAENEIEERVTSIEVIWTKISQQLRFLRRVWESLDEDYRDLQGRILRILENKLKDAVLHISRLETSAVDSGKRRKNRKATKYVLDVKKSLENAIRDLQAWQREFDATWFLVLRAADQTIVENLSRCSEAKALSRAKHFRDALQGEPHGKGSVFLPENRLADARRSNIPFSPLQIVEIPGLDSFVLDSVECGQRKDVSMFSKHIRTFAQKLQQADPFSFNLLNCLGVVRIKHPETHNILSFDFVFRMPKDCQTPQSLRHHLSETDRSLSCRLSLARQLATAVSYLHVLDFVHKGIRPETLLIFRGNGSHLLHLFLLGFKTFRTADGKTLRLGNTGLAENIYQHPERQGMSPTADYIMQHDIYSLGVCLLEIGLWKSFIDYEANSLSVNAKSDSSEMARNSDSLKDYFTSMAKEKLPITMGEKYTRVVVNCLTCMDETNEDFGDQSQFEDEDGIFIGVRYIEKV